MHKITIQRAVNQSVAVPKSSLLRQFAAAAISRKMDAAMLTIRIVSPEEMSELNLTYRQKQGPTNVLSFPLEIPIGVAMEVPLIGDIAICAEIVNEQARAQNKTQEAHWAHMVVHGIFHLLGYDHHTDDQARIMESLEIEILQELNFSNPYDGDNRDEFLS